MRRCVEVLEPEYTHRRPNSDVEEVTEHHIAGAVLSHVQSYSAIKVRMGMMG